MTVKTHTSQWNTMSEFTRVAVALAIGLACIGVVLLLSESGPLFHAGAAWFAKVFQALELTYVGLASSYMAAMCVGVLGLGLAHAARSYGVSSATGMTKKPPVSGTAKVVCMTFVGVVLTVTSVCLALLNDNLAEMHPAEMVAKVFISAAGGWGFVTIVYAVGFVILQDMAPKIEATFEGFVRTIAVAPAVLCLIWGYSALNLGLFIGLVVMAKILAPLESDKLSVTTSTATDTSVGTKTGS